MNRVKGIIAAGTLTGVVLITLIAFGFRGVDALGVGNSAAAESGVTDNPVTLVQPGTPAQLADGANAQEAVQAWQSYSSDLENAVRVMQEREAQYQAELNTANQTILDLQNQINQGNQAASTAFYEDDDDDDRYEAGGEYKESEGYEHDDD
jgi:hypothetical protein